MRNRTMNYKAKKVGDEGEKIVNRIVKSLNRRKYYSFKDVIFSFKNGCLTQIDHLVLSVYGIFVIETKNYKGVIIANKGDKKWLQVLGDRKNFFYSPVLQNMTHVNVVNLILGSTNNEKFSNMPVYSIISFSDSADVRNFNEVVYFSELSDHIKSLSNKEILTFEELVRLQNVFKKSVKTGSTNKRKHLNQVKRKAR